MSRKYKFYEKSGAYFVSFATVYWIDLFIREDYFQTIIQSLNYCRKQKGMILYGYCIMPSHYSFIISSKRPKPVRFNKRF